MKTSLWLGLTASIAVVAFLAGFNISASTGVEPGFFGAVETAGYGAGVEGKAPEGISDELKQYYDSLAE
ncbi:MAG: hypothetical protein JSW10_02320 [Pseudomonadota bacterium]|nr:MAG: hypothetical protein JSW10_02320 [Pseudomonadota bacterium]